MNPMPCSLDAEKGVLCSMILSPELIDEIPVAPEWFHLPAHRTVYTALKELCASGKPTDFISLTQYLRDRKRLDKCGGAAAITDIGTFVATAANHDHYTHILREKYARRRLILAAHEMLQEANSEGDEVDSALEAAEKKVFALRGDLAGEKDTVKQCKDAVLAAIDHIENTQKHHGGTLGISTGIRRWDSMTSGLIDGEMTVIAARPSQGKTALGMQIAAHVALDLDLRVLVFSLEMSAELLIKRILCSRANLDLQRVRDTGTITKRESSDVLSIANKLGTAKLYIDSSSRLSTAQFRSRARKAKRERGIRLIVVDYLQIMHGTTKKANDFRTHEVAEISRTIKEIALELNIPVVAMAQLNRDSEKNSKPRLSNLRECGDIEQDADQVALIHHIDPDKNKTSHHNAILIIAKQRNGPTGEIEVRFLKEYTRFENV